MFQRIDIIFLSIWFKIVRTFLWVFSTKKYLDMVLYTDKKYPYGF